MPGFAGETRLRPDRLWFHQDVSLLRRYTISFDSLYAGIPGSAASAHNFARSRQDPCLLIKAAFAPTGAGTVRWHSPGSKSRRKNSPGRQWHG